MRVHLTVEQRRLALRLRARGLSLREIGPQVGCSHQGVALIVRQTSRRPVRADGWVPGPGRLTLADREEITLGLHAGESFTAIAARLGKAVSTVSREVAANGGPDGYRAWRAHQRAREQARRPKGCKLARPELAAQVAVHHRWHPTCPSVRLAALASALHRLTWHASAPFRAVNGPASAGIRPVIHDPAPGEGTARSRGFPLPFSRRLSLPGHPVPPRDSAPLTIGLPAPGHRTMTGFPRSAHARCDRIGRPLYSGTSGAHTSRVMSPARRLRLSAHGSCTPALPSPLRGRSSRSISQGFTFVRPPGLPLTCGPRMTRAPSGFTPGLRTHASRTRARTPGQGQALSTRLELRHRHLPHASPPTCEFTRTCATSCRTITRSPSTAGAGPWS